MIKQLLKLAKEILLLALLTAVIVLGLYGLGQMLLM